jgi:hypothetical protein
VVWFGKDTPFVIPKPALSARNLLSASRETADSSRDSAALRNDNSLGIFELHHYYVVRGLSPSGG